MITARYPSRDDARALHLKLAPSEAVFELVWTHCEIVCEIAEQLMTRTSEINAELVRAGALLHDIGVYKLVDARGVFDEKNYIRHGIEGRRILEEHGCALELCRIADHHTGVGITREEIVRRGLPLPPQDYLAETREERLVMYADKFHSKRPRFNSFDEYVKTVRAFGEGHVRSFGALRDEFGLSDLETLAKKYSQPIV